MNTQDPRTEHIPTITPRPRRRITAGRVASIAALVLLGTGGTLGIIAANADDAPADAIAADDFLTFDNSLLDATPSASPEPSVSPEPAEETDPPAAPAAPAAEEPEPEPEPESPGFADGIAPTIHWVTTPASPLHEKDFSCTNTTGTVTAKLSDNVGVASASLVHWEPGPAPVYTDMTLNAFGEYTAKVGPFPAGTVPEGDDHTSVWMSVIVTDAAGNTSEEQVTMTVLSGGCLSLGLGG
ncbi:hypothetical protein LGT39_08350 [Demequina sp. TTPB684]|uniref:hypothetical protein n=1 Tax=unclassified Demequina TaxID=2620311 RepID=UPI001CF5A285|nr:MULTISPECIES: hypothetical protein [unclassified Demequina]MCB2412855.1 hypothetical protein [Demequina sp. TTPB684]UPU88168.1 hypothetical protein LGT36_013110 [Demequina sp. TMPB413]